MDVSKIRTLSIFKEMWSSCYGHHGKSIRIVDKEGKERLNVNSTAHLHLQKKSSTYLERSGSECQICSFNLRKTTLTGGWEKLHTEDRDDL